jgi:hypothetical protein
MREKAFCMVDFWRERRVVERVEAFWRVRCLERRRWVKERRRREVVEWWEASVSCC